MIRSCSATSRHTLPRRILFEAEVYSMQLDRIVAGHAQNGIEAPQLSQNRISSKFVCESRSGVREESEGCSPNEKWLATTVFAPVFVHWRRLVAVRVADVPLRPWLSSRAD